MEIPEPWDLKCRRSYASSTIKSIPKKDTKVPRTALLRLHYCTRRTAAHLISPSQPQSQPPVGYHWTRNSRASLSLNPSVPRPHHRLSVCSCFVKLLRVIRPSDTLGAAPLLSCTLPALMYLLQSCAHGDTGDHSSPPQRWAEEMDTQHQEMPRWEGGLCFYPELLQWPFSSFYAICLNYRDLITLIQGNRS